MPSRNPIESGIQWALEAQTADEIGTRLHLVLAQYISSRARLGFFEELWPYFADKLTARLAGVAPERSSFAESEESKIKSNSEEFLVVVRQRALELLTAGDAPIPVVVDEILDAARMAAAAFIVGNVNISAKELEGEAKLINAELYGGGIDKLPRLVHYLQWYADHYRRLAAKVAELCETKGIQLESAGLRALTVELLGEEGKSLTAKNRIAEIICCLAAKYYAVLCRESGLAPHEWFEQLDLNGSGRKDPSYFDPFEVLGISEHADQATIRSAYHKLAAQYHPDKTMHLGLELQQIAELTIRRLNRAYEMLSTETLKSS